MARTDQPVAGRQLFIPAATALAVTLFAVVGLVSRSPASKAAPGAAGAAAATTTISITTGACTGGGSTFCYSPETVTITVGSSVVWSNKTAVGHTATSCTSSACPGVPANTGPQAFNLSVPAGGNSSAFTFTSPGTYTYYCMIHGYPAMHGRIVVVSPEVDRANATISVRGTLTTSHCTGEDTGSYETLKGSWSGSQTQMVPDATDYNLNGPLTVASINWTINTTTKRGVLTGAATLSTSAGAKTFGGTLILLTQGLPAAGATVPARGWLNAIAAPADEGSTPSDDHLIANVEFTIGTSAATGRFGDSPGSLSHANWAAVTNVAPMLSDGVC